MNTIFAVTNACAGCGACLKTCPEKAIRPAPRDHDSPLIVLADRCSGCAECAEVCPVSACVEVAPLRYAPENRESGIGNRASSAVPDATTGDRSDAEGRVPEENLRARRRSRRKDLATLDSQFSTLGEARERRPERSDDH